MNKKVRTGLIVACVIVITVVMVAVINSKGKKSSAMVGGGGARCFASKRTKGGDYCSFRGCRSENAE